MATLYVAEFDGIAMGAPGSPAQCANGSPIAEQTVAIGGSSVACTNPFNASTRIIRVHVDAICSIALGTAPTATASKMRLGANQTEYFGVVPGSAFKIAVITNS